MITLPPAYGQRSPRPFCLKAEMALTHLQLDFELKTTLELNKAPRGKAPWMDDDGIIAHNIQPLRDYREKVQAEVGVYCLERHG